MGLLCAVVVVVDNHVVDVYDVVVGHVLLGLTGERVFPATELRVTHQLSLISYLPFPSSRLLISVRHQLLRVDTRGHPGVGPCFTAICRCSVSLTSCSSCADLTRVQALLIGWARIHFDFFSSLRTYFFLARGLI